jgi:hypothetical protein
MLDPLYPIRAFITQAHDRHAFNRTDERRFPATCKSWQGLSPIGLSQEQPNCVQVEGTHHSLTDSKFDADRAWGKKGSSLMPINHSTVPPL